MRSCPYDIQIQRTVIFQSLHFQLVFHLVGIESVNTLDTQRVYFELILLSGLPVGQNLILTGNHGVCHQNKRYILPQRVYLDSHVNGRRVNMFHRLLKFQYDVPVQVQTGRSIYRHRKEFRFHLQRITFLCTFFPLFLFLLQGFFGQSHTAFLVNLVHHTQGIGLRHKLSQRVRSQIVHLEGQRITFAHHGILNPVTNGIVTRITFNDKCILLIKIQSLDGRKRIRFGTEIQRKTVQLFTLALHQILHRILLLKRTKNQVIGQEACVMHLVNCIVSQCIQFIPYGILTYIRTHVGHHQRIQESNGLCLRIKQIVLITVHQGINTIFPRGNPANGKMPAAVST